MTLDETCELAKKQLHTFIDLVADREFFLVDFWHTYRTTGMLLANMAPDGWRLYNGDLLHIEGNLIRESRDHVRHLMYPGIGSWAYEVEKAKWNEIQLHL